MPLSNHFGFKHHPFEGADVRFRCAPTQEKHSPWEDARPSEKERKACNNSFNFKLLLDNLINANKCQLIGAPYFFHILYKGFDTSPGGNRQSARPKVVPRPSSLRRTEAPYLAWRLTATWVMVARGTKHWTPAVRQIWRRSSMWGRRHWRRLGWRQFFVFFARCFGLKCLMHETRNMDVWGMLHTKLCCKLLETTPSKVFLGW